MTTSEPIRECPTISELVEFTAGGAPELRAHIAACRRCAALEREIKARGISEDVQIGELPSFAWRLPERGDPGSERVGDVCIAASPEASGALLICVVLDWSHDPTAGTIEVAPVSTEVAMAADHDVVLDAEPPLGYAALVEVWNHGTLVRSQIGERLGRLPEAARAAVQAVYGAMLGQLDEEAVLIARRGVAIEADEDPRAVFQDSEAERVAAFWEPAAELYGEARAGEQSATVGTLLSGWLGERAVGEYAREIGWSEREVALLCGDAFEPLTFEPERIGLALAPTGASATDFELALRRSMTLEQFNAPGHPTQQRAQRVFARTARRKGRGVSKRKPTARATGAGDPAEEFERYVQRAVHAFKDAFAD